MLPLAQLHWRLAGPPVRFMELFEDARRRGVLREAGPVYQFRYALLQDHLARQARTLYSG
jgi:hypothetical protein